jgi:hypothetical protein
LSRTALHTMCARKLYRPDFLVIDLRSRANQYQSKGELTA